MSTRRPLGRSPCSCLQQASRWPNQRWRHTGRAPAASASYRNTRQLKVSELFEIFRHNALV